MELLHADGLLTYDEYRRFIRHFPSGLYTRGWVAEVDRSRTPLQDLLASYVRRLAWECAEDPVGNELHIDSLGGFQGARFLLKACEHAARLGIDQPAKGFEHDPIRRFVFKMASLHQLDPDGAATCRIPRTRAPASSTATRSSPPSIMPERPRRSSC